MRRTHLTLLLALSLLLTQTRPALAQAQPAGGESAAGAAVKSEPTNSQKDAATADRQAQRVITKVGVGPRITVSSRTAKNCTDGVAVGAEDSTWPRLT